VAREQGNKILWLWSTYFRGDLRSGAHGVSISVVGWGCAGNDGRGACCVGASPLVKLVSEVEAVAGRVKSERSETNWFWATLGMLGGVGVEPPRYELKFCSIIPF
jgi:hypothetical protein